MKRKISAPLSIVLALAMLLTVCPMTVFAAEEEINYGYKSSGYVAPVLAESGTGQNKAENLPASYDAREHFNIPPVRDQNPYGTCWAHATLACVEVYMLRSGIAEGEVDLSELHLVDSSFSEAYDEMGLLKGDKTEKNESSGILDVGGNDQLGAFTLNRWMGATDENTMNYLEDDDYVQNDGLYPEYFYYGMNDVYLKNYITVNKSNRDKIKSLLTEYGIAAISYYHSSSYLNSSTAAYYNNYNSGVTNHAVTVVGWDDNYAVTNFRSGNQPSSPGAWLVRNSWGEDSFDEGYMWMSYEDTSLDDTFAFFEVVDADTYDHNYQYDGGGSLNWWPLGGGCANVYTAQHNEDITAVSVPLLQNTNTRYRVAIYKLGSNESGAGILKSGTPVYQQEYTSTYAGIYTAEFDEPVHLEKGQKFAVYFRILSSSESLKNYYYSTTATWDWIKYSESASNKSYKFLSASGNGTVLGDGDFRLKVFTVETDVESPDNFKAELSGSTVTLTWDAVPEASSYEIVANVDNHGYKTLATTETNSYTYTATDDDGIFISYKVRATKYGKQGPFCDADSVRFPVGSAITRFSVNAQTINTCQTSKVTLTIYPSSANDVWMTYEVADEQIAQIEADGTIKGIAAGTTTVTAHSRSGNRTGTGRITVSSTVTHTPTGLQMVNYFPATCAASGSYDMVDKCAVCGYEFDTQSYVIDRLEHDPFVSAAAVAPTCTTDGKTEEIKCRNCGQIVTAATVILTSGHTPGEEVIENYVAATCGADGSYDSVYFCTVCEAEISRTKKTPARPAHDLYISKEAVAPACGTDGATAEYSCHNCGQVVTASVAVPMTKPHTAGDEIRENENPASCTAKGSYISVYVCTDCGKEISRRYTVIEKTEHVSYDKTPAVAATCGTDGRTATTMCSVCGRYLSIAQTIPATGEHTAAAAVVENLIPADCGKTGSFDSVVYCSVCSAELSRTNETIPTTSHTGAAPVKENIVAATCTQAGSYNEVVYCTYCGITISTETKTAPATGHTATAPVKKNVVAATCTTQGSYDEVVYCTFCGEKLSEETKTTPRTNHATSAPVKKNVVAATCTQAGSYDEIVYCTTCGEKLSEQTKTTPATGHTAAAPVKENVVATTCTSQGSYNEIVYCTTCGEKLSEQTKTTPATGHTAAAPVKENVVAATCTQQGSYNEIVYCTTCGEKLSEEVKTTPVTAHKAVLSKAAVAATCTQAGATAEYSCSVCGTVTTEAVVIAAKGHSLTQYAAKAATCTQPGYNAYEKCANCDYTTYAAVAALGHDLRHNGGYPASCTEKGVAAYDYCTRCGYTTQKEIPATGHHYEDGYCTACGEAEPVKTCSHSCHSNNFFWKIINFFNKLFKINQYCSCGAKHW